MGDPKKTKKKYSTPSHPWQKTRIEQERVLKNEYGLKNKEEIWVMASKLSKFKDQLKKLNAKFGPQAEKELEQLRSRVIKLGLIKADQPLNTILGLETKDVMERRLQTMVFKKNLARSVKQARQFIIHKHITVNGKKITSPSHIVTIDQEDRLGFVANSSLADPNHPERFEDLPKEEKDNKKKNQKKKDEPAIAAFEEVPEDEEAIIKEAIKKKETDEAAE